MVLSLSSPSPLSTETFHIDNNNKIGKKRKTNLNQFETVGASHASAIIENED